MGTLYFITRGTFYLLLICLLNWIEYFIESVRCYYKPIDLSVID